jgi:hypothetical protein
VRLYLIILGICLSSTCLAISYPGGKVDSLQNSSVKDTLRNRKIILALAGGSVYSASLYGFSQLWYRDYPQSGFHFFNDNREWMSADKLAHVMTSYYVGKLGYKAWQWAGLNEKKATWIGGLSGFFYLTAIEILDGFSAQWGASPGDLAANTLGSAVFISQQLAWHEQKVLLKWSYHSTEFPSYRPDLLGRNPMQQVVKDYNGQTFWLSANLRSFAGKESRLPLWLNVAIGYRATGMTGAASNPAGHDGRTIPEFQRQKLFYVAPDIDLTRIRTHSPALKWVFEVIGFLKFPLPAFEFNHNKIAFKPIYF